MNSAENEDDDELDIYSNLPNFHYDDSLQKLEVKNKLLLEKVYALQKQVVSLRKEFLICKEEKEQLAKNISSLYKSAKQEILRKDRQIGELSARNIILEQRSRSDNTIAHDRRNEDFSYRKRNHSVCSTEKVTKINNSNDTPSTTHRYGTRSKSIKKREDEAGKKCKESKSVDIRKKKSVQKNYAAPSSSRSRRDKSKTNHPSEAISHSMRDSPSPEKLIIVENNVIPESSVEINETENKLDSNEMHDEDPPIEKASPVVPSLPPFVGPKTTFSIRKYKQLYGVSPFKRAKLPVTGNNSLCSSPLKQAIPKNLFCDNKGTKADAGDKINDSLSGVSVITPESSTKTGNSMIIPQLNNSNIKEKSTSDNSSISKENVTSVKNSQKLQVKIIAPEYDISLRKENIERITSKIKQSNNENSNADCSGTISVSSASDNKILSCSTVETSTSNNEFNKSLGNTSKKLVNNYRYNKTSPTSKRLQISRGNFPQVIMPDKSHGDGIKNKFIKVTAQIHADKDGGIVSGTKKEMSKVIPESDICIKKISCVDKVTINSIRGDKILSRTEISEVEKDESSFTKLDKTKKTCTGEKGLNINKNVDMENRISDLMAVTRRDGENDKGCNTEENQTENDKCFVELACSPDSCESFTLEITNSPEPFIEENTKNEKKSDNISSDKISKNNTGAFSEISRTMQTQDGEIKNKISESVSVDLNLIQLSVEKSSDKDCESSKFSGEEQKNLSLFKDSMIPVKNVQSLEKHSEDLILSELENLNKSHSKKDSVKSNETGCVFSNVTGTAQRDISSLKDLMTPEKKSEMSVNCSVNVNLSAAESDSSISFEGSSSSPIKEKDPLIRDSLLKIQASPTKLTKNKYKNKEQQLKDLFGESPLKPDDTSSSCNENIGNNFNLFNSITPILTKIQNKELNKSNLLNLDLSSRNNDLQIIQSHTSDLQNEKRILITPGGSKNFLDFKEAFQYGKTDAKNLCNDQVIGESNLKCLTPLGKNNSLDKENPNHNSGQKISPVSSNIKNVLCDKSQKNNSNITGTCVKPIEPVKKKNESAKNIENEKSLGTNFSPGGFGSEVYKTVAETSNIKNDVLKFSDCTSLLSCEDSTIHMIKTFSKVGDSISPIKTPLKLSDVISEQKGGASAGQTFQNTKSSETNKSEITYNKISHSLMKISDNSRLTNNDDCTLNFIRNFSELNNIFVSPLKTPMKLNDKDKEQTTLDQNFMTIKPVPLNDSVKSLTKSAEKILTPTVIKKDGVSVCLSSEHCEFKRKRPIRKNIKFHNLGKQEPMKVKEFEGNTPLSYTERKFEDSLVRKTTIIDEPENKKRRIVCSSLPKVLPKQKEKEADDDIHEDQRKLNPVKNSECQKRGEAIIDNKKSEQNFNIIKSNNTVNKIKFPSKQEHYDELEGKQREDNSRIQKGELNRISNTFSRTVPCDSKNRLFLSPSVCERRSPSEYFNRQHRRQFRRDNFHSRRSNRRLSRQRSPPYFIHKNERKLEMKLRSEVTKQRKLEKEFKLKFKSQSSTSLVYQISKRNSLNRSEVRLKEMDKSSGCDLDNATLCFPLKRLSVSPNVKEIPSPVKPVEENHMEWKVVPLQINEKSNLIGKFVSHKIIPKFIGNLKNKDTIVENQIDDVNKKNCDKKSISVSKDKNFPKPGPVVFMKRTKRLGAAHLEDSKGFSPSISPNKKSVIENQIKANLTEDDKNTINNTDQEGMNKKKLVQKTRCIVKTPLDFKTQFGDIKVSSDENDLSISSSSEEESRHSDESWRPKKRCKLKRKC